MTTPRLITVLVNKMDELRIPTHKIIMDSNVITNYILTNIILYIISHFWIVNYLCVLLITLVFSDDVVFLVARR